MWGGGKDVARIKKEFIKNKQLNFGVGQGKVVLMTDKNAYGFYDAENGYYHSKRNYEKNYSSFNYPCVTNVTFIDSLKCIVMDKVQGISYNDLLHDKLIIKKLLELQVASSTIINPNGEVLFLQHGDANRANIIWVDNEPIFIDLDNIGYYPPLLDIIHYCCSVYDLLELETSLNENDELVRKICDRVGIETTGNYLDDLFYRYVNHYIKMNCCFEDFKIFTLDNTKNYPRTNELLQSIKI